MPPTPRLEYSERFAEDLAHAASGKVEARIYVWWRCKRGHEWQAIVSRRAGGHDPGCPYCAGRKAWPGFNDLATLRPDLAAEWHPHMNGGLAPADVTPGSNKAVWWRAGCGHVFELKVCVRAKAKASSCPYCSGKKVPERPIKGLR